LLNRARFGGPALAIRDFGIKLKSVILQ